jgi:hypothetical protein
VRAPAAVLLASATRRRWTGQICARERPLLSKGNARTARAFRADDGNCRTTDDFADDDWRKTNPRFMGENFERNLRIADEVASVAPDAGATPAQVALAWLLRKGDDILPIPGTKRTARVEENCAADSIELSAEQIQRLDDLTPAAGGHHNEDQMRLLER